MSVETSRTRARRPASSATSWGLLPASLLSASAVLIFGLMLPVAGYALMATALALAWTLDLRRLTTGLLRDLALIAIGLVIISTISLEANISYPNMALMGTVLALAVAVPYLLSRYVFGERAISFPWRTRTRWTRTQWGYLALVLVLGWSILPFYFITSGAYHNWPAIGAPDELARLFVGVNAVGIWDELFFICTVFALLRRHFPNWQANILQSVIFVSFLWELGYQSWGPLMTVPFALLQGYTFALTKSLAYVITVHLLFDAIVFLVLVHAHNPQWFSIFLY